MAILALSNGLELADIGASMGKLTNSEKAFISHSLKIEFGDKKIARFKLLKRVRELEKVILDDREADMKRHAATKKRRKKVAKKSKTANRRKK